jgi:cobaltochelatase CobN
MVINPQYFESLINTPAGMNSWASRMQNMYASTVLGGQGMSSELGNQMADTALSINSGVNKGTLAPGIQSSMAWLIYMNNQGLWNGDPGKVQQLVDSYMQSVIEYGVACCHHTCKNLAFNMELIQMSSLTPAQKQKFAEILAQATNTDPLYQMEQDADNNVNQGDSNGKSSGNKNNDGKQSANTLANGTSQQKSDGSNDGGHTSAGEDASQAGDAKSASEMSSSQDASSSGGGSDSGAKAYELSDTSTSKSVSATESSMPIFVIIAVIALIAIFLVGYVRDNDDDYDDY